MIMKKFRKPMLCALAALMLVSGCSKKTGDETGTSSEPALAASEAESTASEAGSTVAEPDKGRITSLGKYKGVEVTKDSTEVTDEELDTRIQSILDRNPEYIEVKDRPAKEGDVLKIDFVGMMDGEAFDGGSSEGYELKLGSHTMIAGFEEGLVGARTGDELSLNLTFPEVYEKNPDLAGKPAVFDVTVNSVEEAREAVLDDNFVQRISDFSTVDEFKADLLNEMKKTKEETAEQKVENDVLQAILDDTQFELNQEAVDAKYEELLASHTSAAGMYGMTMENYVAIYGMTEEEFQEELKKVAEDILKQQLVFEEIAKVENFEVDDTDRQYVADEIGTNLDVLKESYGEALDEPAMMYKVIRFIKDHAVVK